MKINFKGLAVLAAVSMFSASAFAQSVEFTNEVSSDVASIRKGAAYNGKENDDTVTDFAGIEENVVATFTSEKVDAELDVTFILDDHDDRHFGLKWDDVSWFVEFRPVEMVALGFHEDIYTEGSYLPIYDDNLGAGNLGSEGFTVAITPVEGLKLAVTAPFGEDDDSVNWFSSKDDEDDDIYFNVGFGAEYAYQELFSIGASVQDVADSDERVFGVFGTVKPLADQELLIRAGYSYNKLGEAGFEDLSISEDFGVLGENVINASAEYAVDALSLAAEFVGNTDDADSDYDMYFGAFAQYDFTEAFGANVTGKFLLDNSSDGAEPVIGVNPNVYCNYGSHSFSAGVNYETCDGDSFFSFPLSWTYSF